MTKSTLKGTALYITTQQSLGITESLEKCKIR